jgi:hypothetical protein
VTLDNVLPAHLADLARTFPHHVPPGLDLDRAIVYRLVSNVDTQTHDGPAGLPRVRYQFTAHGETHAAAVELAGNLAERFRHHLGAIGGAAVTNARVENLYDLGYSAEAEAWQYALDVVFHVKE